MSKVPFSASLQVRAGLRWYVLTQSNVEESLGALISWRRLLCEWITRHDDGGLEAGLVWFDTWHGLKAWRTALSGGGSSDGNNNYPCFWWRS
jgi:hypothetical protein